MLEVESEAFGVGHAFAQAVAGILYAGVLQVLVTIVLLFLVKATG